MSLRKNGLSVARGILLLFQDLEDALDQAFPCRFQPCPINERLLLDPCVEPDLCQVTPLLGTGAGVALCCARPNPLLLLLQGSSPFCLGERYAIRLCQPKAIDA